jgi:TonB family protein
MRRRLFDDLVLSGSGGGRSSSAVRTLPFSLALHAMAVAALATLSVKAIREEPQRTSAVLFTTAPRPAANAAPPAVRSGISRVPRRTETPRLAVEAPPVVTDVPAADIETDILDAPAGDLPICLSGCTPGVAEGGNDDEGASGPGGTGDGSGPPRRVGGDIQEPRRIHGAAPAYPDLARRAGVSGKVVLECVIDENGRVTDLKVVNGNPLLADAAVEAVRRWVYTPTRLNGQAVSVILTVTVKFGLARN